MLKPHNIMRKLLCPWELYLFPFWGQIIGSALSALGSAESGRKAGEAHATGKEFLKKYEGNLESMNQIADTWMKRYQDLGYGEIEEGLAERVREGPDIAGAEGEAAADVAQVYDKEAGMRERRLKRYGIDPGSGRFRGGMREIGLDRAKAEVMARNKAREEAKDKDWSRKLAFTQMGRGLEAGSADLYGSAGKGYQAIGDEYSGMSGDYAKSAGRGMATAGKLFSGAMSSWGGGGGGGSTAIPDPTQTPEGMQAFYEEGANL